MDDQNHDTQQPLTKTEAASDGFSFADFLESTPPGRTVAIASLVEVHYSIRGEPYHTLLTPDLQLHCSSESCNGLRFFRFVSGGSDKGPLVRKNLDNLFFVSYRCSNCQKTTKVFSLRSRIDESLNGECYKLGEIPSYGPPTPARLISLIGPDRDIFLKGRRCENQGLGIGAFVYYRRVVENQKNRILEQIIKVSEKVGAPKTAIDLLSSAKAETQFSRALELVKDAIPQSLLIKGQNPMTLLHSALSEGLHAQADEQCLEIAQAVRVVLAELSERLGQALKEEAELNHALSRLMALKKKPSVSIVANNAQEHS